MAYAGRASPTIPREYNRASYDDDDDDDEEDSDGEPLMQNLASQKLKSVTGPSRQIAKSKHRKKSSVLGIRCRTF